ncbi:MAG TPA: hypothetical protein VFD70_25065 [Anaerolineae bacterium]|nr:hypothetical protein [Anaerolineae bacterium]
MMNLPLADFALLTVLMTFIVLLALDVLSGAPSILFLAFLPAIVWGIVIALKGRRNHA